MCSSKIIISEEFFDGKDVRAKNSKTLTASVYHTLLTRQIPLAITECKQITQMKSSIQQVGQQIYSQVISII